MPEEVMEEILLRLPPKSLMRFKCVSNSWYDLVTEPSFINKHLLLNANNGKTSSSTTLLLRWKLRGQSLDDLLKCNFHDDHHWDEQVLSLVTIFNRDYKDNDENNDQIPCVVEELNMQLSPNGEELGFLPTLVGSHCSGIICLVDCFPQHKDVIYLCNPSLREFKLISTPCRPPNLTSVEYGFGYDPKADDYKFVRILSCSDYSTESGLVSRAQVYSLGTDSWREIKMDMKLRYYNGSGKGVYLKGVYYWWNKVLPDYKDMILSFDMSEEKFQSIPLPDDVQRFSADWRSLAVWNESLALFFSARNSLFSIFEMWVMLDDFSGDEGVTPWIRHLRIGPLIGIHSPVAFWNDDELLMDTRYGGIVSYNLSTKKVRKLPIHGAVIPGSSYADFFQRSLVSVKGGNMLNQLINLDLN